MTECLICGHDALHDRSRWMQCQQGECPCELRDKVSAEKGAEEALRRVLDAGYADSFTEGIIERVRKEMGIGE